MFWFDLRFQLIFLNIQVLAGIPTNTLEKNNFKYDNTIKYILTYFFWHNKWLKTDEKVSTMEKKYSNAQTKTSW